MDFAESFKNQLFQINEENFETNALSLFEYQYEKNSVYQEYANFLDKTPKTVSSYKDIPFLPIEFWKTHEIKTGSWEPELYFLSSGTGSSGRSKSMCKSTSFYESVSRFAFESFFDSLNEYEILALLPSYQENPHSSLIYMVDHFMSKADPASSYYQVTDHTKLKRKLEQTDSKKLLIGVSYALLDLVADEEIEAFNTIIMETGGMKGRKKEIIRSELHQLLKNRFTVDQIYSEYGMSELTSQAYTLNGEQFTPPAWMKILIRDTNDPLEFINVERTGGINIIDLANVDTCSFIETKDLGKMHSNGTFEVLGRFDNTDIRGCNLLIA